jgi:hypothetical protein
MSPWLSSSFGVIEMSAHSQTSVRVETGVIVALATIWMVLWLLPRHVWFPIPPYREDPDASVGVQALAYTWAALLLILPLLLPLLGGHLTVRRWADRPAGRSSALATFALAVVPLVVIGGSTLMRITDAGNIDSAASPLFYWWPR